MSITANGDSVAKKADVDLRKCYQKLQLLKQIDLLSSFIKLRLHDDPKLLIEKLDKKRCEKKQGMPSFVEELDMLDDQTLHDKFLPVISWIKEEASSSSILLMMALGAFEEFE